MPEGDTILRTARTLGQVLEGRSLERVRGPGRDGSDLEGHIVRSVEARGKNLLMHLDDGRVIYSHMGMVGSWHVYRPGEAWRKPERLAALVLETGSAVAVCFNPPTLEILDERELEQHRVVGGLGPDILAPGFETARGVAAFRGRPDLEIGVALLDQALVCGIGNVYKSECLFLAGVWPFARVAELDDAVLGRVLDGARTLMRRNLDGRPRRTRFRAGGPPLWVYGRGGQPCLRCGDTIVRRTQGARSTWFCPGCQQTRTGEAERA